MKKLLSFLGAMPVIGVLIFGLGVCSPVFFNGCGTLDKTGVYAGNKVLYDADLVISSSYQVIHSFVVFELQNRASLPKEVTAAADRIRAGAPQWFASALALSDAYKGDPSAVNASNLQKGLDVIRAAVAESTRYLVVQQLPNTPK